ncbi:MAG: hypothetical protein M3Y24_01945 [Acidobacteriota bacterium]|nr:hypothetical protein [Acidobacteriota bacterium]
MSTERINKFQPDKTFSLGGFTGFGAAASLCETSPTGFKVYGVFRDQADFCVLDIYNADNAYEHYSVRYLSDFNVTGLVLNFNLSYENLQPIDSAKYSWIDWAQMDVLQLSGEPVKVAFWDHATLAGGSYSVAQGTYAITAPGGCTIYDRLTLFINNVSFDFVAGGQEPPAYVAQTFHNSINTYDWSAFTNSSVAVIASADNNGNLTLKNARAGRVAVNGTSVTWTKGIKFPGIAAGSTIYLGGAAFTVAAVNSPTTLTLTGSAGSNSDAPYLAEYGGVDGNDVQVYMVVRPGNQTLAVNNPILALAGGNSDNVVWNISLDFAALGIDQIRRAWFTFAPQLASGAAYSDREWTATFSNWTVVDPNGVQALQCAGPGSMRVGNCDGGCTYTGPGWSAIGANNYWRGFGRTNANVGDSVTVNYTSAMEHDLYLGTSLFGNRGTVSISLDGNSLPNLDCFLNVSSEVVTRRLLQKSVGAGAHTIVITLLSTNHQTQNRGTWDVSSTGFQFLFDYLEAACPSDLPNALVVYDNVSAALDFDTDATYKVSPQRLLWHLNKLGLNGQLNEYLGVYWWNQRKRVMSSADSWPVATVTFEGTWAPGDVATVSLGTFSPQKSVTTWDTVDSIAEHFVYYINAASVSMWAEKTGAGQMTIHSRTPNWGDTLLVNWVSTAGTIGTSGSIAQGTDGMWEIDTAAPSPINFPVTQWHADLFKAVQAAGLLITTSFSMELVNPPDDDTPANAWKARFGDDKNTPVDTATDFMGLFSSQCAPIPNLTNYQKSVYTQMAGLQSAAGLTPWLQFGEFVWWYFSFRQNVPIGYASYTSPISIGLAQPHKFATGDRVVVSGVGGMTSANGTWTITVTDDTHFTLNGSIANGAWNVGTGTVSGGSMGYYDPVTTAAASAALNRPLYGFTCQDDDPSVNGNADANFLAAQLKAHVDAIREAVLASYPNAKFELLYPNDVNNTLCYRNAQNPYPQGGRLNAAVNLPIGWRTKAGSGLDRLKVEALSWGATYRNLDLAAAAMTFALSAPLSWSVQDLGYLIPWFNGECPWPSEFQLASTLSLPVIDFWAYDHLGLMSWPVPFPSPVRRSFFAG